MVHPLIKTRPVEWTWTGDRFTRQKPGPKQTAAPPPSLLLIRARYYDPNTGQFISRDPLGYVDGMSQYRAYFVPGGMDPLGKRKVCCFYANDIKSWKWTLEASNSQSAKQRCQQRTNGVWGGWATYWRILSATESDCGAKRLTPPKPGYDPETGTTIPVEPPGGWDPTNIAGCYAGAPHLQGDNGSQKRQDACDRCRKIHKEQVCKGVKDPLKAGLCLASIDKLHQVCLTASLTSNSTGGALDTRIASCKLR